MQFEIYGRKHNGETVHLFSWTRDLQAGLRRAHRDAKAFGRADEFAEIYGAAGPAPVNRNAFLRMRCEAYRQR